MSLDKSKSGSIQRKLMDEGLKLIAIHGLYGCKVEDITNAAAVGKGTFFNYFGSKDMFIAKLVEQCLSDLARRLSPLKLTTAPPESFLTNLGGVYLRYFQLRPEVAALLIQAKSLSLDTEAGQHIQKSIENHLSMVSNLLEPIGKELGWEDNLGELSLSLFSLSCAFFWMGQGMFNPPAQLLERLGKVLAKGLTR